MSASRWCLVAIAVLNSVFGYAQRALSEGTVIYNIEVQSKDKTAKVSGNLNGAQTTIYLKGLLIRTDMTSNLGTETTIYNAKLGNAAILKEYSGQKLMITLTQENWNARNRQYEGINFRDTAGTKQINGYNCKLATGKLKDGSRISVYYTPDLAAVNKDFIPAFKNLDGFPMEYELENSKLVFRYLVSKIDFSPLPTSKFELPRSGYRVMTYDESKSGKAGKL